jgi:hypothetical protein
MSDCKALLIRGLVKGCSRKTMYLPLSFQNLIAALKCHDQVPLCGLLGHIWGLVGFSDPFSSSDEHGVTSCC